jgi:hypothetical protein
VHRVGEVARCFIGGETKVGGAELEQVAAGTPSCQGQRRIGSGGQDEMNRGGACSTRKQTASWISAESMTW